jgi:hypothetical protein
MKKLGGFSVMLAVVLVLGLAVVGCDNSTGGSGGGEDPIASVYQGEYGGTGINFSYLKVGANSVQYGANSSSPLTTIEKVSTSGGSSKDSLRWDYIWVDGAKFGIAKTSPGGGMVFLGKTDSSNQVVALTMYFGGNIDVSDISDSVPNFEGYKLP